GVDGESLADALRRGPRPIPTALTLVRDVLGAAEYAHARGVILRRIVPLTLMLELSGRAVITDLRYANWCLPNVPPEERGAGGAFVAPEVRAGGPGEPASDVYAVAALVYYVLPGHEPDADPARVVPPRQLRPAGPAALERVLLRALQAAPASRYYTATEMLEDFVSDAGVFQEPAATPPLAEAGFERRLRRALGDDYELLEEIGTGGFGRVYRARDLGLERDVAIKVLHPSLTADAAVAERFRRDAQLAARRRAVRRRHLAQRHAPVRGAGAAPGRARRPARGPVLARRDELLRAARPAPVRGTHARSHPRPPDHRRCPAAHGRATRRPARAGRGAAPGAVERPGRPVPDGDRLPGGGAAVPRIPAAARGCAAGRLNGVDTTLTTSGVPRGDVSYTLRSKPLRGKPCGCGVWWSRCWQQGAAGRAPRAGAGAGIHRRRRPRCRCPSTDSHPRP